MKPRHQQHRTLQFESLDRREVCAADLGYGPVQEAPATPQIAVCTVAPAITAAKTPDIAIAGVGDGVVGIGYLGSNPSKTITIKNEGSAPLVITSIAVPDGYRQPRLASPLTVAPGGTYRVAISLDGSLGKKEGNVTITSNDPDEGRIAFHVTGKIFPIAVIQNSTAGLQLPTQGVFRDFDTRLARRIEIAPPHGRVPIGTRYVLTVELANGTSEKHYIGGSVSLFQFSRARPAVFDNWIGANVRFR